jgi:hypothetical protein
LTPFIPHRVTYFPDDDSSPFSPAQRKNLHPPWLLDGHRIVGQQQDEGRAVDQQSDGDALNLWLPREKETKEMGLLTKLLLSLESIHLPSADSDSSSSFEEDIEGGGGEEGFARRPMKVGGSSSSSMGLTPATAAASMSVAVARR